MGNDKAYRPIVHTTNVRFTNVDMNKFRRYVKMYGNVPSVSAWVSNRAQEFVVDSMQREEEERSLREKETNQPVD